MMAGFNGNEDEWSSYQQVGKSLWKGKGCINWRKSVELTGIYKSFSKNFLCERKEISRKGYFIFSSLLCMCVPLKKRVLCSEKNILKKLQSAQQSQIPEGRRAHRCQMHLSCYQSWRNGNVWPVIHFRFYLLREWPGHWVHGRKMETVQREDLPKTIMLGVFQWQFLAGIKDSRRNLCPQALVLHLTSPSVWQTLLLLGLHCNLKHQKQQAKKKPPSMD